MTGSITLNLPLKSYLVKYLTKKYGDYHVINRNSWLGSYFIELLDKQYRKQGNIKDGDYYQLVVPKKIIRDVGFDMPASKFARLEQMIDKLFRNALYDYIVVSIENKLHVNVNKSYFSDDGELIMHKQDVMKAMQQFFYSYNITEDDVKLESIYKDYYRFIKKRRHKLKIKNRPSSQPNGSTNTL